MSYCRACGLVEEHWRGLGRINREPGDLRTRRCPDCQALDAPPIRKEAS